MKEPVFMNSCGILYGDEIVFAFENGEKRFLLHDIRKLGLRTETDPRSWFIVFALACLMLLLFFTDNGLKKNFLFTIAAAALCTLLAAAAIAYRRRTYIVLRSKGKRKLTISVSDQNKKDATKFISRAVAQMKLC